LIFFIFFQIQNYKNFSILILLYWGKIYFRALPKFLFFLFFRKFFIFWGDFILRTLPQFFLHSHAFTLYRFIPLNHSQHSKLSDNSHNYLYAKPCIHIHLPYFTLSVKFYQFQNRIEQLFFYHIFPVNLWYLIFRTMSVCDYKLPISLPFHTPIYTNL